MNDIGFYLQLFVVYSLSFMNSKVLDYKCNIITGMILVLKSHWTHDNENINNKKNR